MKVLVTGAAGFIGYHVARRLAGTNRCEVLGVDNLNDYYDVELKLARLALIQEQPGFSFQRLDLADREGMAELFARERPERVIHLAAQAGVRYSLDHPHAYADANLTGGDIGWLYGFQGFHVAVKLVGAGAGRILGNPQLFSNITAQVLIRGFPISQRILINQIPVT